MISRTDFEGIAAIVARAPVEPNARDWLAHDLAKHFAARNPDFDRVRFFKACGT